jgi:hypothetical protein
MLLLLLAFAAGCTGFFQNPVLTGLTVGPQSPNIQQGTTLQMSAIGTYDDGSTKTLTSGVFWSSDDTNVAPITSGGRVTGASSGTATITASASAQTGTSTVTVTLNNVTSIVIQPTSLTIARGNMGMLTVTANPGGQDVTSTVTWTITDSSGNPAQNISITTQTSPATVSTTSSTLTGTYKITATYSGNTTLTNSITLTVT